MDQTSRKVELALQRHKPGWTSQQGVEPRSSVSSCGVSLPVSLFVVLRFQTMIPMRLNLTAMMKAQPGSNLEAPRRIGGEPLRRHLSSLDAMVRDVHYIHQVVEPVHCDTSSSNIFLLHSIKLITHTVLRLVIIPLLCLCQACPSRKRILFHV